MIKLISNVPEIDNESHEFLKRCQATLNENIIMPSEEDMWKCILDGGTFNLAQQPDGKIKLVYVRPEEMIVESDKE